MSKFKSYQKDFAFSYCFGAFACYELIKYHPGEIIKIVIHSSFDKDELIVICDSKKIEYEINDTLISKLSPKENCYVMAIFNKYETKINNQSSHLVLVNPSNMGNLGTIIRTMLGFGIKDLAIIRPGVDYFDPKVVRSSMGSIFAINIEYLSDIESYVSRFPNHELFPFMLQAATSLTELKPKGKLFSLIFGNEATGLADKYLNFGKSVIIKHSTDIDSLNLTNAVSIALYEFCKDKYI
jgi:TrmH family RNA methyltransferase